MKLYTTNQIRKFVDKCPSDFKPKNYHKLAKKYNLIHTPDPTGDENMSGRAWVMWLLDELDKMKPAHATQRQT